MKKNSKQIKNLIFLVGAVVLCQLAGIIGSVFTVSSIPTWYVLLNKPWFNPPNWIFGPVWTTLYTFMGISLFLVWRKEGAYTVKRNAYVLFGLQLLCNSLWSIVFFGLKDIAWALGIIVVLWFLILATIYEFYRIEKRTSYLLVPYILWVSFAALLNFSILMLN